MDQTSLCEEAILRNSLRVPETSDEPRTRYLRGETMREAATRHADATDTTRWKPCSMPASCWPEEALTATQGFLEAAVTGSPARLGAGPKALVESLVWADASAIVLQIFRKVRGKPSSQLGQCREHIMGWGSEGSTRHVSLRSTSFVCMQDQHAPCLVHGWHGSVAMMM